MGHKGNAVDVARVKVGPCSHCPEPRVVLAVQDKKTGGLVFFCRACVQRCEVRGVDGVVRDATDWPDLIGTEAN